MTFFWDPLKLPEFEGLPREERSRIWDAAWRKAGKRWYVILAVLGALLASDPIGGWLEGFFHRGFPRLLCKLLAIFSAYVLATCWMNTIVRPLIWREIPGRCPSCGYDVRATPERCPECGAAPAKVPA